MKARTASLVLVATLWSMCASGCTDRAGQRAVAAAAVEEQAPTPTALWANRQVDTLLAGGPDVLSRFSEQLRALAIIEDGDADAALSMDLRQDEMESIWGRVRERYDTEWVRGYMVSNTRAAFVHTLASLYVRDRAPELLSEMPGDLGAAADQWPAWLEAHGARLGVE